MAHFFETVNAIWEATPWQMQIFVLVILTCEYMRWVIRKMKDMAPVKAENTTMSHVEEAEEAKEEELSDELDLIEPREWVEDQIREIWKSYGLSDPYSQKTGS